MARARSGGSPSAAWAVTLLGAGFFICGILAVLFFAQKGGVQEELDAAERDLRELVNNAEANSPAVQEAKNNDQGMTAVGFLLNKADQARNDLATANQSVSDLQVQKSDLETKLKTTQGLLEQAQRDAAATAAGLAEARSAFDAKAQELEGRVAAAEQTNTDLKTQLAEYETAIRGSTEEARRALQNNIDQLRVDLDASRRELASAQAELVNLRGARDEAIAKIADPDADVATITNNGNTVYLNIGRNQKVTRGLTFSIFDADDLVKLEGDLELEPKAVVDVFEVLDNSSTARVVQRQLGKRIDVGDAAINLAFDPNRVFRFFVFGDFDIDNTGDANDIDRIKSRIRQWDSQVADAIDYNVDFLVLGKPPALPRELTGSERSDPIRIQEYNAQQRKFNEYNELLAQAKEFNIPVLSQNRFLALVGYYQR